ncbi:MAG: DUF6124 family protein [Pseudomonas sp.]
MRENTPNPPHTPSTMLIVAPGQKIETLLAHACESLASASAMASNFAAFLEGSNRHMLLGIQQSIMLGDLMVNQALDQIDPQDS